MVELQDSILFHSALLSAHSNPRPGMQMAVFVMKLHVTGEGLASLGSCSRAVTDEHTQFHTPVLHDPDIHERPGSWELSPAVFLGGAQSKRWTMELDFID